MKKKLCSQTKTQKMKFRAFASQTLFSQISRIHVFWGRKFFFDFSLKKNGKFLFEKKVSKMVKYVNLRKRERNNNIFITLKIKYLLILWT
jgi:hypothetical protein